MDEALKDNINKVFGNQLRIRVCGICIEENSILLVRHEGIGDKGYMWAPPGGGIHFGEQIPETLEREFQEETGLAVQTKELLFVNEFFRDPLHALELFFRVDNMEGTLVTGNDPEMKRSQQIISNVKFIDFKQIKTEDPGYYHNTLQYVDTAHEMLNLNGFFQNV